MKTIVIGLGNPIRRDDGIGVTVARMVREKTSGRDVRVMEISAGGLRLMDEMVGYDRAIIIDSIQTRGGAAGAVYRFAPDDMPLTRNTDCTHDTTLVDALRTGRELGMRLPDDITIFAVEAADVDEFGEEMTVEVAAAAGGVAGRVLALCGDMDGEGCS